MSKVNAFSAKGIKQAEVSLPKQFAEKENLSLLSQAIHIYRDRAHIGLAKTKTRGEVARTTKKWYRQKGTGGARHGARSAPIFVGGGTAHGPKLARRELAKIIPAPLINSWVKNRLIKFINLRIDIYNYATKYP